MKKLILMLLSVFLLSCSIDRVDTSPINTFSTQYVNANEQYPNGGYWIFFYTDGILNNSIFLSNGKDGKDGLDGLNGNHLSVRFPDHNSSTNLIKSMDESDVTNGIEKLKQFLDEVYQKGQIYI